MIRALSALCGLVLLAAPALADVSAGAERWRAGDWAGAVAQWQGPASRGDADAMFNMGQAYRLGRGVPRDNAQAIEYYRRASDKGHVAATANLGIALFQDGRRTEAMVYLRQAADKGDPRATYVMGIATFNGDGAARNPVLGYAYMIRAREGDMPQASQQAARMATLLSEAERARAEAAAAALAAGEPVPVELISPGARMPAPPPAPVQSAPVQSAQVRPPVSEEEPGDASQPEAPAVAPAAKAGATPPRPTPTPAKSAPSQSAQVQPSQVQPSQVQASQARAAAPEAAEAGWRVQLGAYATEQAARTAWATLVAQSAGILEGQKPAYSPRGGLVRLQVGPFGTGDEARDMCQRLSAAGRPCFVTRS